MNIPRVIVQANPPSVNKVQSDDTISTIVSSSSLNVMTGMTKSVSTFGRQSPIEVPGQKANARLEAKDATATAYGGIPILTRTRSPEQYRQKLLDSHNLHSRNHSADNLTWSADMASRAATQAQTCVFAHNMSISGGGYGQNIFAGVGSDYIDAGITNLFYNSEFAGYDPYIGQANPDMTTFEGWGHLTQIVWNDTREVGCFTQFCLEIVNGSGVPLEVEPFNTVCNYRPPGNVIGHFDHVYSPQGNPTVTVSPAGSS